jgi:hypothetical protein
MYYLDYLSKSSACEKLYAQLRYILVYSVAYALCAGLCVYFYNIYSL